MSQPPRGPGIHPDDDHAAAGESSPTQHSAPGPRRSRGRPPHPDILTPREWEVLDLLRERLTNRQIAERLGLTIHAARYHVSQIISKLNVTTREEAAVWRPEPERTRAPEPVPRPGWQRLLAPLTLAKAAGVAASLTAVAGLAVLAWGVLRTSGGESGDVVAATETPPSASAPDELPSDLAIDTSGGGPIKLTAGLYESAVDGSELVRIAAPHFTKGAYWSSMSFSPDGRWLAYVSSGESRVIYVKDLGSSAPAKRAAEFASISEIAISPNGDRLIVRGLIDPGSGTNVGDHRSFGVDIATGDITSLPSLATFRNFAWSPDGRWLAFIAGRTLGVADEHGENVRSLTDARAFSWSPDSKQLAVAGHDQISGIALRSLDGTARRIPLRYNWPLESAWSPDGSHLVVFPAAPWEGDILVLEVKSGESEVVASGGRAAWAHDGSRIAYIRGGKVLLRDLRGGEETELLQAVQPLATDVIWRRDDEALLFAYNPSFLSALTTIEPDGANERHIGYGGGAVWSPDGSQIALHGRFISHGLVGSTEVWVLNAEGIAAQQLGSYSSGDVKSCSLSPPGISWTPDGTAVIFTRWEGDETWMAPADGSSPATTLHSGCAIASPSGDWLIVPAFDGEGRQDLLGVTQGGGSIIYRMPGQDPSWSPDGKAIAYWRSDGVYVADSATGDSKRVAEAVPNAPYSRYPPEIVWSKNSQHLAFTVGEAYDKDQQLFVVAADGSTEPWFAGTGYDASLSSDGAFVAFVVVGTSPEPHGIYVVEVGGGEPRFLTEGTNPNWSPDGSLILFER